MRQRHDRGSFVDCFHVGFRAKCRPCFARDKFNLRAARLRCASHAWPMVGNSYSPITTLLRFVKSIALATELIPAEALGTTATSSVVGVDKSRKLGAHFFIALHPHIPR